MIVVLPVEIRFFHRIVRKEFHRPTDGRLWCDKIYSGGNLPMGFQWPISVHPTIEKSPTVSSARPKQKPVSRASVSY